jgi:hypothetical protein
MRADTTLRELTNSLAGGARGNSGQAERNGMGWV